MPRKRARRIFSALSKDLARVWPAKADSVLCPLCLKEFRSADVESGELTEEHIVPRSIGGRQVTLACKECNNTHGTDTDSHLVQYLKLCDAFKGLGTLKARVEVAGERVRADFAPRSGEKDDPNTFRVRRSDPRSLATIQAAFRRGEVKRIEVKLRLDYIEDRLKLALVKTAYLGLFDHFGYAYILSPGVRQFWTQLNECGADLNALLRGLATSLGRIPRVPPATVSIVRIGSEVAGAPVYLVILKLTKEARCFAVLMPTERQNADSVFRELQAVSSALSGRDLTVSFKSSALVPSSH